MLIFQALPALDVLPCLAFYVHVSWYSTGLELWSVRVQIQGSFFVHCSVLNVCIA